MNIEKLPEAPHKLAERAIQLIDIFFPSDLLWKEALEMACEIAHPVYDCLYLTLARQEKATLLTADRRLIKIAGELIPVAGPEGLYYQ